MVKIKADADTIALLRWLGQTMQQPKAIRADLVVEGWTIIRWYKRNLVRLHKPKASFEFDPGESISIIRYLDRIAATDPLSLATSIDLINQISQKITPNSSY